MRVLDIHLKDLAHKCLGDIRNLGLPISSISKSISEVIFVVTEVIKLNFQASSNKFYCNNVKI
jgi:hypothetical protein